MCALFLLLHTERTLYGKSEIGKRINVLFLWYSIPKTQKCVNTINESAALNKWGEREKEENEINSSENAARFILHDSDRCF